MSKTNRHGDLCVTTVSQALGYFQATITSTAAVPITSFSTGITDLGAAPDYYIVVPESAIRFRDDGTVPTTAVGMPIAANAGWEFDLNSVSSSVAFIPSGSTSAVVNVAFYRTPDGGS